MYRPSASKASATPKYGYSQEVKTMYSITGSSGSKTTNDIGVGYGNVEFNKAPRKACGIVKNTQFCGV